MMIKGSLLMIVIKRFRLNNFSLKVQNDGSNPKSPLPSGTTRFQISVREYVQFFHFFQNETGPEKELPGLRSDDDIAGLLSMSATRNDV